MTPLIPTFFATPVRLAALREAAAVLLGTPFFPNSEAPGLAGGIDCAHTLNWLYRTTGVIDLLAWPRQAMDHGQHADHSLLIEALDTWPALAQRFACVWRQTSASAQPSTLSSDFRGAAPAPLPGDALCFLAGKVSHHGGVMLEDGEFLHTLKGPGVHRLRLDVSLRGWRILGHLAAIYRPLPLSTLNSQPSTTEEPASS